MKLLKASDEELQYLNILVFGPTGIGKTTSLTTLGPLGKNALIVIPERGAVPLRKTDLNVVKINTWDDMRTLVRVFLSTENPSFASNGWMKGIGIEKTLCEAVATCKLLVVDSLSALHDMLIRHIVEVDRRDLLEARGSKAKQANEKTYEGAMSLEDWGLYKNRMLNLISTLCHLPVHLICSALGTTVEDKRGMLPPQWAPAFAGKTALECGQHFGNIFSMESMKDAGGADNRVWRTKTNGQIQAKDESGVLDEFEETNWLKVIRKIMAKPKGGAK